MDGKDEGTARKGKQVSFFHDTKEFQGFYFQVPRPLKQNKKMPPPLLQVLDFREGNLGQLNLSLWKGGYKSKVMGPGSSLVPKY